MIETQVLIQEIQKKHQITLKPDDLVFVAVTLNELLLSHYLEKFQSMLEVQNKLVAFQGIERLNQASAIGSEMINRSLEALSQTLDESANEITQQVISLSEHKNQQQAQSLQKMGKIRLWGFYSIIACISFILGVLLK